MRNFNQSGYAITVGEHRPSSFQVLSFESTACGIVRHYCFQVRMFSEIYLDKLDQAVCLSWGEGSEKQYLHGTIREINFFGEQKEEGYLYEIQASSPLHVLVHSRHDRVFVDETPKSMVEETFKRAGFSILAFKILISDDNNPKQDFICQYDQTDWSFLLRLFKQFGWYCYWEQTEIQAILIICDSNLWLSDKFVKIDFQKNIIDFQYKVTYLSNRFYSPSIALDLIKELFYVKTNINFLVAGCLIEIHAHPVGEFNKIYRVLQICHRGENDQYNSGKSRYENIVTLIPCDKPIRLMRDFSASPAMRLFLMARVFSEEGQCPDLDEEGRYKIQFDFDEDEKIVPKIKLLQCYAGENSSQAYGIHFPLRPKTPVMIGFIAGNIDRPIIVGAMSDIDAPSPVTAENFTQHRLKTFGQNELLFDDDEDDLKIKFQTLEQKQMIIFNATEDDNFLKLISKNGEVNILAEADLIYEGKKSCTSLTQGKYIHSVEGSRDLSIKHGNIDINNDGETSFSSRDSLTVSTEESDIIFKSEKNHGILAEKEVCLTSDLADIHIKSSSSILSSMNTFNILAPEIKIGAINILKSLLNLGGISVAADSIDWYPPIRYASLVESQGKVFKTLLPPADIQHTPDLQPLIVVSFYQDFISCEDGSRQYFDDPTKKDQYFNKNYLRLDELQYFKTHGNNVTLFIHGYDVVYHQATLPWWQAMEWNLNKATKQFDEINYESYTRMLHIAWRSTPRCGLDYMASVSEAKMAGKKLAILLKQLHEAGMEINIIAHSLGNQLLLTAIETLENSFQLNQIIMWEAAIPNDVFLSSWVYLSGVKKIKILYSCHDNVLGNVENAYDIDLYTKSQEDGVMTTMLVGIIFLLDHLIRECDVFTLGVFKDGVLARQLNSLYLLSNLIGCPMTDFFDDSKAVDFYSRFINQYDYQKCVLGKLTLSKFPETLRDLEYFFILLSPTIFIATIIFLVIAVDKEELKRSFLKKTADRIFGFKLKQLVQDEEHDGIIDLIKHIWKNGFKEAIFEREAKNLSLVYPKQAQAAAIILAILISNKPSPCPAMGYSGPINKMSNLMTVDQKKWLFSHSGMKHPNANLMKNVYMKFIMDDPDYHFGLYKKEE